MKREYSRPQLDAAIDTHLSQRHQLTHGAVEPLPEATDWQNNMDCQAGGVEATLFEEPLHDETYASRIKRQAAARQICRTCSVRLPCLTDAIEQESSPSDSGGAIPSLGIRGGLTRQERDKLRRKQPGSPFGR
jgi:hypothetical protein